MFGGPKSYRGPICFATWFVTRAHTHTQSMECVIFLDTASLPLEVNLAGEQWGEAGDLLPLVHVGILRSVGLETDGHNPLQMQTNHSTFATFTFAESLKGQYRDGGHQGEEVILAAAFRQDVAERLDEPGSVGRVPPRIEARDGRVGDEEVRMGRDLVSDSRRRVRVRHPGKERRSSIQPVALTSLNQRLSTADWDSKLVERYWNLNHKDLGLAGQCGTLIRGEVRPELFRLVLLVLGVEDPVVPVGHECDQDAIVVAVILTSHC